MRINKKVFEGSNPKPKKQPRYIHMGWATIPIVWTILWLSVVEITLDRGINGWRSTSAFWQVNLVLFSCLGLLATLLLWISADVNSSYYRFKIRIGGK